MQQPKKYSPKEKAPRAYDLFKRAEKTRIVLTLDVICKYTGYSERTFKGYWSKKYRQFLHHDGKGGYTVNGLGSIGKAEFLGWHSQLAKKSVSQDAEERYYRLESDCIDMCLVIAVLVLAGIWWRR